MMAMRFSRFQIALLGVALGRARAQPWNDGRVADAEAAVLGEPLNERVP